MTARYLIRFDDLCPTMNWKIWDRIEQLLLDAQVAPILAVVPDNRDPKLQLSEPRSDFWSRVREWQSRGWAIGMHGFQHRYVSADAGLVGVNARSEFAGRSMLEQEDKIGQALQIFATNRVRPDLWIAPGHSFDRNTLSVLSSMGIRVLSDGFFFKPIQWNGMIWVPQQIWRFRRFPFGVWTVCLHHNSLTERTLKRFESDLAAYRDVLLTFSDAVAMARPRFLVDELVSRLWLGAVRVQRMRASLGRRAA